MQEKPIKCECGKVILKVRDGKLYGFCKRCKKEIPVELPAELEPSREQKIK